MTNTNTLRRRIAVVLTALPTWLAGLAIAAGLLLDELPKLGPLPPWLAEGLAGVITAVAVAVVIIRRVTPVVATAVGILKQPGPVTELERTLLGELVTVSAATSRPAEFP